jgi:hypothetical protein
MENQGDELIDNKIRVADFYSKIASCAETQDGPYAIIPFQLLFHRYRNLHSDSREVSFNQFCEDLEILKQNGYVEFVYDKIDPETDETYISVIFKKSEEVIN